MRDKFHRKVRAYRNGLLKRDNIIKSTTKEPETLKDLFITCNSVEYFHDDRQSGDYAYKIINGTLYLYFQGSNGKRDWLNNFFFFATPYKDMSVKWYCHRGFLRVWKSLEPYIKDIFDRCYRIWFTRVVIVGYSHGGALATLAHEWVWFNFPDLRKDLVGYGFGTPRVYFYWFAHMRADLKERWATFYPIRNSLDLVTHLPFNLMGFRHVNKVLKLNTALSLPIRSHYPEKYEESLEKLSQRADFKRSIGQLPND